MNPLIHQTLETIGDTSPIKETTPVSGGDINQAFYVRTKEQEYFVKTNKDVPEHFFRVEAKGLSYIRDTKAIRVPEVYHYDEPKGNEQVTLVMEWLKGDPTGDTEERLGRGVANMHKAYGEKFGFEEDTFIGSLPQPNRFVEDWTTYYHDYRLIPQFNMAAEKGQLPLERKQRLKKLMERLPQWLTHEVKPSLLHGDLWGGNWMAGPNGDPCLIDPSVFYGDHAFEMAFTEVFGGYSDGFYRAYQEEMPLPENYEDIKPLYQLYYLLAHLNLFGEAYAGSVDRILKRYVG